TRGSGREVAAVNDDDVGQAPPRAVVGDREAEDAAADDDQVGLGGDGLAGLAHSGSSADGSFTKNLSGVGLGGGRAGNGAISAAGRPVMRASARATTATHSLPWHGPVPNPV